MARRHTDGSLRDAEPEPVRGGEADVDQQAVIGVLRTADAIRRRFCALLEPRGLSVSQYNVLRILRGAGPAGLRTMEIADRMLEKTPGVTRLLDRLEAQGWVKRHRSTRDRRVVRCAITDPAKELLATLDPLVSQVDSDCLELLDEGQKRRLVKLLETLLSGLAPCLLAACLLTACALETPRSVLLVSLDTTRRDHLQTYGYPRETSPQIDRLAARSVVFEHAVAQMTITNPSHASMLTGLYPHTHGVGENTRRLADEHVTLTEILRDAGFRTGAFVSGHPLRKEITGIDQGFEVYDSELRRRRAGRDTLDRALDWLRVRAANERWFLFVHLYDAHGPYRPSPDYLEHFRSPDPGPVLGFIPAYQRLRDADGEPLVHLNDYVDRYDAMIRTMDDLVGELLAAVDLDHTAVVVLSDHGETLGDRATPLNLNHGTSVFGEQTAIPWILYSPQLARRPRRFEQPVETVDLLPTLLSLLDVPLPPGLEVEGRDLVPQIRDLEPPRERAFAHTSNRARTRHYTDRGYRLRDGDFIRSVRTLRYKLIQYPGVEEDYFELYDLREDPQERHNLAAEQPRLREGLRRALDLWRGVVPDDGSTPELSDEDLEQLRALGYL